ncbi:uncharacterized protein ACN2A1_011123 [Glossina fuscipes fuscipes]
MATISLTNYDGAYENYEKCGEILKSPTIIGKHQQDQHYALLCLLCQEICLQFETFIGHIEQEHGHNHEHMTGSKLEIAESNMIKDEDVKIIDNCYNQGYIEEDEKNIFMDPLEEPEVMLVGEMQENVKAYFSKEEHSVRLKAKYPEHRTLKEEPPEKIRACRDYIGLGDIVLRNDEAENCGFEHSLSMSDNELYDGELSNFRKHNYCKYNDDENSLDNFDECSDENDNRKFKLPKKTKSTELDIDKFMEKRQNVLILLAAYEQQDELWDSTRPPKLVNRCRKKRERALTKIADELKEKVGLVVNIQDVDRIIKYLRVRYIREVRIRLQFINKDDYKPLWFYEKMEFLKPTLPFIQEMEEDQLLAKPELNSDQIIKLIEIYKIHSCLWDEQDIYYNSEQRRQEALRNMCQQINEKLNLNYLLTDVENKIDFIHKMVKKEKESQIEYQQQRDCRRAADPIYKSSNRFYDNIAFLLPHLGPFKCSHCPKIIYHINTFRIHTAKHDGSKPFKCRVCQYEFTQKPGYVIHLRRHTQDFPFVCKFCQKGFPCKKELKLHFQNHPEYEKEYICDVCGDGFTQQKLLNWHLKVHSNTRDSICNECGKGFTNSKLLFQHRSVHSKEKSVCKLCSKTYAHYRGLSRHMIKDHGTTVAAVAAVLGEKPKKRVLNINEKNSQHPERLPITNSIANTTTLQEPS